MRPGETPPGVPVSAAKDTEAKPGRRRLSETDELRPWVRAELLEDCFLYWLPVSSFPMRHEEKAWLSEFLQRLSTRLQAHHALRPEVFLQYKSVNRELLPVFVKYRQQCTMLIGLGRKPGARLPPLPTEEQIRELARQSGPADTSGWIGDYSYWFVVKQAERQRELFLGNGGMTTIFLPPDPATTPPKLPITPALRKAHPVFQVFDVEARVRASYSMTDRFLKQSKTLFGAGLEEEPQFPGLMFILPLLDSAHFFSADEATRSSWFQLFNLYVNESAADKGVILASRLNYETDLERVLASMREDNLQYPESAL